eukprot:tig00020603_g11752.t1
MAAAEPPEQESREHLRFYRRTLDPLVVDWSRVIGRGSFGVVRPGRTTIGGQGLHVAVKVQEVDIDRDDLLTENLWEGSIHARLGQGSRHIVQVHDSFYSAHHAGIGNGYEVFLVMEMMQGNLGAILRERKASKQPFEEAVLRDWLVQICRALDYLHSLRIPDIRPTGEMVRGHLIHRDVKLQNVLFADDPLSKGKRKLLKLGDFGIAKLTLGPTHTRIGTQACCSPEVLLNEPYDASVDLFSLGVLLFNLAVLAEVDFSCHCTSPVYREHGPRLRLPHADLLEARYSRELSNLIFLLLSFRPDDRPKAGAVLRNAWLAGDVERWIDPVAPAPGRSSSVHGDEALCNSIAARRKRGAGVASVRVGGVEMLRAPARPGAPPRRAVVLLNQREFAVSVETRGRGDATEERECLVIPCDRLRSLALDAPLQPPPTFPGPAPSRPAAAPASPHETSSLSPPLSPSPSPSPQAGSFLLPRQGPPAPPPELVLTLREPPTLHDMYGSSRKPAKPLFSSPSPGGPACTPEAGDAGPETRAARARRRAAEEAAGGAGAGPAPLASAVSEPVAIPRPALSPAASVRIAFAGRDALRLFLESLADRCAESKHQEHAPAQAAVREMLRPLLARIQYSGDSLRALDTGLASLHIGRGSAGSSLGGPTSPYPPGAPPPFPPLSPAGGEGPSATGPDPRAAPPAPAPAPSAAPAPAPAPAPGAAPGQYAATGLWRTALAPTEYVQNIGRGRGAGGLPR